MLFENSDIQWKIRGNDAESLKKAANKFASFDIELFDYACHFEWKMNIAYLCTKRFGGMAYLSIVVFECNSDWVYITKATDSDIVLTAPLHGRVRYSFLDEEIEVAPGESIIYQYADKLRRHAYTENGRYRAISLKLSDFKAQKVSARRGGAAIGNNVPIQRLIRKGTVSFELMTLLMDVLSRFAASTGLDAMSDNAKDSAINMVAELLYDVMDSMPKIEGRPIKKANSFVRTACQYMNQHYKKRTTIQDVAASCGVSARTLERGFRDELGLSPAEFIKRLRLDSINTILSSGVSGKSVSMIANECGYSNRSLFIRDYVARFGEVPKTTRKLRD